MDYDSMEGLEFGGAYGGLLDFVNQEMLMQALTVAAAGGGAILVGTYGVDWLMSNVEMLNPADPTNKLLVKSGLQIGVGLLAGGMVYQYSEQAAMGVVAGLGALAVANLVNGLLLKDKAVPLAELSAGAYSDDFDGIAALSALEATGVSTAAGAFADPSVTNEALMGTIVQSEELGAYQPYLA